MDFYLEMAKLLISGLTPLFLVLIGYFLNQRLKDIEQFQWSNQKAVEKRIDFYYSVTPRLNHLLCFFTYVGKWKEFSPPDIVRLKRDLDEDFYINAPILPANVMTLYFAFIDKCYQPFNGQGQDAKLKTDSIYRQQALEDGWIPSWANCFAEDAITPPEEIQLAYNALVKELAGSLGIKVQSTDLPVSKLRRDPR